MFKMWFAQEWAGGTQLEMNGVCDYTRFPTPQKQLEFCKAYSSVNEEVSPEEIMREANRFVGVNHWYWGLWGLNQAILEGDSECI